MRFSRKSLTLVVLALPALFSGCSPNTAATPTATTVNPILTTTTSKSGLVPAMQVHNPKVTVTPSRNLVDGQKVTVSVTGFGQGGKFFLSECADASDANNGGCGHQLAVQRFGITDNNGSGSYTFTVSTTAAQKPYSKTITHCTNQCVIVATVGLGYGFAYAPIEFAGG